MSPSADIRSERGAAEKPCHNCRRRRLRCDRTVPHCSKCESRGIECLGYGQLFLWTGAVASRGKLAGQKSSAALYPDAAPGLNGRHEASSAVRFPVAASTPSDADSDESRTVIDPDIVTSFNDDDEAAAAAAAASSVAYGDAQVACITSPNHIHQQLYEYENDASSQTPTMATTPWVLVDPLFQDMKYSQRQYLAYFSSRLCRDFVADDVPERNPFRSLLPLTQFHPLLHQVIIAASAAHMYNRSRPWLSPGSLDRGDGPRQLLVDALVAKQQVLQMMSTALQNIDSIDGDVLLASVLFLINVELIESGKNNWKAHLEGAGRIMSILPVSTVNESLRNYLFSDCFVYYILESTFRPFATSSESFFHSQEGLKIFANTVNNYYCCPPEVLEIMLTAAQLSSKVSGEVVSSDMITTAGAALFNRAQNIDVIAWAKQVETLPSTYCDPVLSRFRVASVHKLGLCLYILHAIPDLSQIFGEEMAGVLLDEIQQGLIAIPEDDPNFKATSWVTFVFGASVKTPERKEWVIDRIQRLILESPWGYWYAARDALQKLWALQADDNQNKSWVQLLRDLSMDLLVV
ncbi:fungal-specific transcription factor domain-containing protein [Mariannaea sp. PMI_226]|nr:fungal-specific transcription factor domain-containing protein [Mariannaea sp. PMI_226]